MDETAAEAEKLVKAYQSGQIEALGKLVELYRRPLFGFILSMTEGRDDAEEIFQDVWFKAIKNIEKYKSKRFLSWLFRIAHNITIDRIRKMKPDASLQDRIGTRDGESTIGDTVVSNQSIPTHTSANKELGGRIQAAASDLPSEQREVFLMRTHANMPFKEIAQIQNTSVNTVLARMQYALAKMREQLKEDYECL